MEAQLWVSRIKGHVTANFNHNYAVVETQYYYCTMCIYPHLFRKMHYHCRSIVWLYYVYVHEHTFHLYPAVGYWYQKEFLCLPYTLLCHLQNMYSEKSWSPAWNKKHV